MPFPMAVMALIDCEGDEKLALRRLEPRTSCLRRSVQRPEETALASAAAESPDGFSYRQDMHEAAFAIGGEVVKWVNERRVKKDWAEVLLAKKPRSGGIATRGLGLRDRAPKGKAPSGESTPGLNLSAVDGLDRAMIDTDLHSTCPSADGLGVAAGAALHDGIYTDPSGVIWADLLPADWRCPWPHHALLRYSSSGKQHTPKF